MSDGDKCSRHLRNESVTRKRRKTVELDGAAQTNPQLLMTLVLFGCWLPVDVPVCDFLSGCVSTLDFLSLCVLSHWTCRCSNCRCVSWTIQFLWIPAFVPSGGVLAAYGLISSFDPCVPRRPTSLCVFCLIINVAELNLLFLQCRRLGPAPLPPVFFLNKCDSTIQKHCIYALRVAILSGYAEKVRFQHARVTLHAVQKAVQTQEVNIWIQSRVKLSGS